MLNACKGNSNCCREESDDTKELVHEGRHDLFDQRLGKENGEFKKIIEGEPDQSKAVEIGQRTEREYVAITAYQPVDIVTRTVEVPFVRTIETMVPKITYESKIREVPKYYSKIVEKVVEVPEVKFVDKIVDVPRIQYCFKYVPKVEVKENIIERPVFQQKIVEKIVEVPKVKEMQRFQEVETVEYVIKYVPKGFTEGRKKSDGDSDDGKEKKEEDTDEERDTGEEKEGKEDEEDARNSRFYETKNYSEGAKLISNAQMNEAPIWRQAISMGQDKMFPYVFSRPMQGQMETHAGMGTPWGSAVVGGEPYGEAYEGGTAHPTFDMRNELSLMQMNEKNGSILPTPRIEQVFKPKIVKNIEVQKHVPISVDVPVPYMVPKPVVVNVEVPVLKFRDTFVPVPVRRKIIPKIKWISDVYQVECIKEKPYLKIQDVIRPIPCDVQIKYRKYMEKACAVNPNELPQDDVHAMWMRVNAHLAEQKKREYGDLYPYYRAEGEGENESNNNSNKDNNSNSGKEEQDGSEGTEFSEEGRMHEGEMKEGALEEEGEVSGRASKQEEVGEDKEERGEGEETIVIEKGGVMEQREMAIPNGEIIQIGEVAQYGPMIEVLRREQAEMDQTKVEEWRQVEGIEKVNAEQNIFYAYEGSEQMQKEGKSCNVFCKNTNDPVSGISENEDRYNFECVDEFMKEMKKQDNLEEGAVASLYPSHPLAMTYLQNKWIQTDTLRTHELYQDDFVRASINANFNLQNRNPVISEVMKNQNFLKTANPLISPFFPRNIQNIENAYNRVIVQNIQEENMRCQGDTNKYERKVHTPAGDMEVRMYDEGVAGHTCASEGKCCSYFCKH
ncbi:inner membrane complex protein 1a, putative [Plasmodium knowlesi strain H]|uniref:Inner membrane complex protein 1a, putative n=3 Tax=Plasmodium knowlesi TaxID=5850 RepID=A0A5E7X002_PLAKH|nr:inner membrane complex protein 1a, putative [Plasmodium knowlesi strain H]OTN65927.1 putative Inner membrane complex protein 1a [Plasmodium knowlesi]CAA9988029.1 inner membrane complex protein 1a, putative [Plasmodium knowlesi strain H]SBO21995.1 inner membrane complex protein 1a, putative [Plasmodium knowlesi strain H]SBO29484.1 inner membrane complex protein 1a, putative [Plasmodium knowlesi strain H]VVS77503.1 inner membrane complex protein 1a, putative [Plasmodium knowlesi strain H]